MIRSLKCVGWFRLTLVQSYELLEPCANQCPDPFVSILTSGRSISLVFLPYFALVLYSGFELGIALTVNFITILKPIKHHFVCSIGSIGSHDESSSLSLFPLLQKPRCPAATHDKIVIIIRGFHFNEAFTQRRVTPDDLKLTLYKSMPLRRQ